jgi:membrane protease YdiL (CAAX protease family)
VPLLYAWICFGTGRKFYSNALLLAGADSPNALGRQPQWIVATIANRMLFWVMGLWSFCLGLCISNFAANPIFVPILGIALPLHMFCFDAIMYAIVVKELNKPNAENTVYSAHYHIWALLFIETGFVGALHAVGYTGLECIWYDCFLSLFAVYLTFKYAEEMAANPRYHPELQSAPDAEGIDEPLQSSPSLGIRDVGTLLVLVFGGVGIMVIPMMIFHSEYYRDTILGELALSVLPVAVFCRMRKLQFTDVVPMARITLRTIVSAIFIALGIIPWLHLLYIVTFALRNTHLRYSKFEHQNYVAALSHPILAPLVLGLAAGITEEVYWRGPLLKSLRNRMPLWSAILVSSVLFAAVHCDINGMLDRTIIGVMLGWLVVVTGSVVPGMIVHAIYDAFLEGNRVWRIHALYMYNHFQIVHTSTLPALVSLTVGAGFLFIGYLLIRDAWIRPRTDLAVGAKSGGLDGGVPAEIDAV